MTDERQEYEQTMTTARQRLRAALDPQTDGDEQLVTWLCDWDRQVIEGVAGMVERRLAERPTLDELIDQAAELTRGERR